jgi:hypothetical protein
VGQVFAFGHSAGGDVGSELMRHSCRLVARAATISAVPIAATAVSQIGSWGYYRKPTVPAYLRRVTNAFVDELDLSVSA